MLFARFFLHFFKKIIIFCHVWDIIPDVFLDIDQIFEKTMPECGYHFILRSQFRTGIPYNLVSIKILNFFK